MKDPKKDFNSCESFLLLVVRCHILCAAMEVFGMTRLDDQPSLHLIPSNMDQLSDTEKCTILQSLTMVLLEFVHIHPFQGRYPSSYDGVNIYASEVLSLGLLYMEFRDGIREGDGFRVLRCWKYLTPLFKATRHKNYALEGANFLTQYYYILPPRQAHQLLWSRFVNTRGQAGHNIPCDLHLEHLNRICKSSIKMLGSNKTVKAIQRVGRCLNFTKDFLSKYDADMNLHEESGSHIKSSDTIDCEKILVQLFETSSVFSSNSLHRHHAAFKSLKNTAYSHLEEQKYILWLSKHFLNFMAISTLNR